MTDVTCKPNFFIVGAPKSGTTSLHNYLSEHPDVFMSKTKEPCFLAPDFSCPTYPQTEEEYLLCFRGYSGEIRIGESTTSYLYSKKAARAIHNYAPSAKIIAMLRNPVDLVVSLHAQYLKMGIESITRLQDALVAETGRSQGKCIPKRFRFPNEYLLYREVGKYAEQLSRYLSEFGGENVHVIIFDDFERDPASEFAKVCHFLDISTEFKPDMKIHNPAQTPRSVVLLCLHELMTPILVMIGQQLRPIIPVRLLKLLWRVYRTLWEVNMKMGRTAAPTETLMALATYYEQEIKDIETLLRRDLSCWRLKNQDYYNIQMEAKESG
ncbi:MAG: sulfotransferase [Candidatus Scalindua sp.]|nr:sulfotransferase [Candidatus Scalindua sp.]